MDYGYEFPLPYHDEKGLGDTLKSEQEKSK